MRLLHYSPKPFEFDPKRRYEERYGFKPVGLWVSVEGEDDWKSWCESEEWGLDGLKHAYEVTLKPAANILRIDSVSELDAFNARHRRVPDNIEIRNIKWDEVKALHDGLIIAPYQWERRLDLMWYYGWDCASGVIWNLDAVEVVREVA